MPLRGNKFRMTTSPRVTLALWKKSWLVVRGSWLVKTCHYTRIGCDQISQRAAQGSLYRGAGRQRRSERLKVAPYAQGRWPYIFLQSVTALFPSPDCDAVGDGQRASRREACAYPDFMTGDSLFVKTCHYTRIGCDEISLAGFLREAPTVRPWAVYFCELRTANG